MMYLQRPPPTSMAEALPKHTGDRGRPRSPFFLHVSVHMPNDVMASDARHDVANSEEG